MFVFKYNMEECIRGIYCDQDDNEMKNIIGQKLFLSVTMSFGKPSSAVIVEECIST